MTRQEQTEQSVCDPGWSGMDRLADFEQRSEASTGGLASASEKSYSGILKAMRVLVGESVYEDAQVSVSDGILWIEFESADLDSIAISLDVLGIRDRDDA